MVDRIGHRIKLQALVSSLRKFKIQICTLQEISARTLDLQVFYIEEFCFIIYGRVAVVLINAVARLWEQSGRAVV